MDLLLKFMRLDWWVYIIVVVTFFTVALFLNYVLKKVNESRLDERFNGIHSKASNNRPIPVRRRFLDPKLPSRTPLEIVLEQSNPSTVKGISLVYNKEENCEIRNLDRIDIKNFPSSSCTPKADETDGTSSKNGADTKPSDSDITPPIFLGKIYNEINIIERSKSLSNADTDNDAPQKTYKMECKKQESKSTPSVKKMLDNQYKTEEDFRKWTVKQVGEDLKPTSSLSCGIID